MLRSSGWDIPSGDSPLPGLQRPTTREVVMLMLAVHETPTLTRGRYEEVVRRLTNGKRRIEASSDLPLEGLVVHAAGQGPSGFYIFDVFESEDAVERFRAALGTISLYGESSSSIGTRSSTRNWRLGCGIQIRLPALMLMA